MQKYKGIINTQQSNERTITDDPLDSEIIFQSFKDLDQNTNDHILLEEDDEFDDKITKDEDIFNFDFKEENNNLNEIPDNTRQNYVHKIKSVVDNHGMNNYVRSNAKSHSLSYPFHRRLAIAPDETEVSTKLNTFHIFSPFYANWQKNCDALTYYKRRNSFPHHVSWESMESGYNTNYAGDNDVKTEKYKQWSIFKLFDKNGKKQKSSVSELDEIMNSIRSEEGDFKNSMLHYKNQDWTKLWPLENYFENDYNLLCHKDKTFQLKNAIWELYTLESEFYFDTLLVLRNVYMYSLKAIQVEGYLMDAEPEILFGNLEEICTVTQQFCKDLIKAIEETNFDLNRLYPRLLILNKDKETGNLKNNAYHKYCLNYLNALNHLYILRYFGDFCQYETWCRNNPICKKRSLSDLLISPVQHFMKIPLIYKNILKRSDSDMLKDGLGDIINDLDKSLQALEEKMKWMKNYKQLQEIDNSLIWPRIENNNRFGIYSEVIKKRINANIRPLSIANPRRRIIQEGNLSMIDMQSKWIEVRVFLFEDVIIIAKIKKSINRKL
ncbi:pleckstrin homology domain-containing family G member 7-like isoform X2 [Gordionus sp. m RMFG-2023]|uniref:pleckstrin homology domain-containing family G member 7-like isoform X2 n=1 Tax=Gordionus sp. m RMFG-2023 TaxID=3053472 RepID=UPI0031FCA3A0